MRESFSEESKLLECDEKKRRGNADFSGQEMSNSGIVKSEHSCVNLVLKSCYFGNF